jgi:hypothetical protein
VFGTPSSTTPLNPSVVLTAPKTDGLRKGLRGLRASAHWAQSPQGACGPWRDGGQGSCGHQGWTCEHGNRDNASA